MKHTIEKTLPRSFRVPKGVFAQVREGDGAWVWQLRVYRKLLAEGRTETEKASWRELKVAMGKLVDVGRSAAEKNAIRQKLRSWGERRPYLVCHVLDMLSHGMDEGEIVGRAEEEEKILHAQDLEHAGFAWPIPTHANAKSPAEAAGIVKGLCEQLGIVGSKASKYGAKVFGLSFSDPQSEEQIEVVRKDRRDDE